MELPGYTIEKQIGKGGMAKVYLALHQGLDRQVAIKVMSRHLDEESGFSDRFMREARIVANLGHQNIVTVYDVGKHDGYHYIAMEYLPGGITLDHKIKQGINAATALITLRQVAAALGYAHEKGIVHRDVKPENIMYREDGSAVLTDFGIARSTESTTKMTATGTVIGTPHYMSPEQAQGHEIGAFSDIYSLGVVFYEALTGHVPYDADSTIAVVFKHITEPVPVLDGDLAQYQPILTKMMGKQKEDRYQNCAEIISDIDTIIHGGSVDLNATQINNATMINTALNPAMLGKKPTTSVNAAAGSKNKRFAGIGALVITLAAGAGGYLYYQDTAEQQAQLEQKQVQTANAEQQKQLAEKQRADEASRLAQQQAEAEKQQQLAAEKARADQLKQQQESAAAKAERVKREAERKEQERLALLDAKKKKQQQLALQQKTQQKQASIDEILSSAEADIGNKDLDAAYDKFQQVLQIDSTNSMAKTGVKRIATRYLVLAKKEAVKGEFDLAEQYIDSAINIAPTHKDLADTQKRVFTLRSRHLERQAQQNQTTPTAAAPEEEKQKRRSFGGF